MCTAAPCPPTLREPTRPPLRTQPTHPSSSSRALCAVSPAGHLVVADYQNDRLQCFEASTGRFLHTIGRHGNANGEFERPFDVAIASDGHILATDYENHRVQARHSHSQLLPLPPATATACCCHSHSQLLPLPQSPLLLPPPRALAVRSLRLPPRPHSVSCSLPADHSRAPQVLSPTGEYVSHFGSHGSGVAQFDSPGGVAVSPDGDVVVVTDCGNGRFHLYKEAATVPATLPASASGVAAVQPALMLVPPPPMPTPIAVPGGGG